MAVSFLVPSLKDKMCAFKLRREIIREWQMNSSSTSFKTLVIDYDMGDMFS